MGKVVKRLTEQELRSTLKACRKYERALIHSDMPRRSDGDVRKQFDDYRQAAERNEVMTGQVRQILCQHGIQPCRFVPYYNFALHVAKLARIESTPSVTGSSPAIKGRCWSRYAAMCTTSRPTFSPLTGNEGRRYNLMVRGWDRIWGRAPEGSLGSQEACLCMGTTGRRIWRIMNSSRASCAAKT